MPAAVQIKKRKNYSRPKLSQKTPTEGLKEAVASLPADKPKEEKKFMFLENANETETIPTFSSKKIRSGVIVEQVLAYNPGKNKPMIELKLRLTTAIRGKRKQDQVTEAAYLLRLEVINCTEGTKVEGFQLGPWNNEKLNLDKGGIVVCEPMWTGFQPFTGPLKGRMLFHDTIRHRLIDLPWKTEGIIPGAEPFPG